MPLVIREVPALGCVPGVAKQDMYCGELLHLCGCEISPGHKQVRAAGLVAVASPSPVWNPFLNGEDHPFFWGLAAAFISSCGHQGRREPCCLLTATDQDQVNYRALCGSPERAHTILCQQESVPLVKSRNAVSGNTPGERKL